MAGFLLSDIKKQVNAVDLKSSGLIGSNSIPGISDTTISSLLDAISSSSSNSRPVMSAKMKRSLLLPRSPKSKGSGRSAGKKSQNSNNSSDTIKYSVPLNMLISVSVFTLITAIASVALIFLWPSWVIIAFWILVGWDIFLAILWVVAAGLTGKYLTQNSGWKADFKQAHLFKACFALAFIFMLSFIGSAVYTFLMCWAERKKTKQEGGAENPGPVNHTAPAAPAGEKGMYVNEQPQQYLESQQQQPYQPAVSPNPSEIPYQPTMSPQPYQLPVSPVGPSMSPPPPGVQQVPPMQQPGYQ